MMDGVKVDAGLNSVDGRTCQACLMYAFLVFRLPFVFRFPFLLISFGNCISFCQEWNFLSGPVLWSGAILSPSGDFYYVLKQPC